MSIAYSHQAIIKAAIRADSSANFRADVDAALLAVGWAHVRTVTLGFVYRCTAPVSGLTAKLTVQDAGIHGLNRWITFQGMSEDETTVGIAHGIIVGNGTVAAIGYQMIAGACQLFLSLIGFAQSVVVGDQSYAVAFGIPALPPNTPTSVCLAHVETPAVLTDIWWSNGPGDGAAVNRANFRTGPRCFECFCYSVNGVVTIVNSIFTGGTDPSQGMLTLFYLTPTNNVDYPTNVAVPITTYSTHLPLNIDALIGWLWQIRGQLWDAFQRTAADTLDDLRGFTDIDDTGAPVNFIAQAWNSSYYSSLWLITAAPTGPAIFSPVAYIY